MKKCITIVLMILSGLVLLVAVTNFDDETKRKVKAYRKRVCCGFSK